MKHGLTAKTLLTPEETQALHPDKPVALHLATEVVLLISRIERAQQIEERERGRGSIRAAMCWTEDRNDEAERLARGLAKRPERTARKLRMTPHGCTWMIERWERLGEAAKVEGGWIDTHQTLAADLRGIPLDFRFGLVPAGQQLALVESELTALKAQRSKLAPVDEFERDSARCGLSNEATPELRRVLRYEAALHRRLEWCLAHAPHAETKPTEKPAPAPQPAPKAAAKAEGIDFDRDLNVPAGRKPLDLPPAMGSVLPISMIPPGSRAR